MDYFTALQTAKKLGVSARTLMRWRKSGKFVPVMITMGGHSRYSEDQIKIAQQGALAINIKDLLS